MTTERVGYLLDANVPREAGGGHLNVRTVKQRRYRTQGKLGNSVCYALINIETHR